MGKKSELKSEKEKSGVWVRLIMIQKEGGKFILILFQERERV